MKMDRNVLQLVGFTFFIKKNAARSGQHSLILFEQMLLLSTFLLL